MDSKRRMVELHTWEQPFFSELTPAQKLLYWFMISKCDNIGVYRHNPRLVEFHCGEEVDLESFVQGVNFDQERVEILPDGCLWIKDFVRDTWGVIAAGNNLGLSCYKLLMKHNLLDRFASEYPESINTSSFREYIEKAKDGDEKKAAYTNLSLPQVYPKVGAEQGQSSGKPGTINNPINGSDDISITKPSSMEDPVSFEREKNGERLKNRFSIEEGINEDELQELPFN